MHSLAILVLTVLACISYGVIHDQFTARLCVEYFTIGHPRIVPTEDPTILAILWGVIATWWVGVLLGVPLAFAARFGPRAKRSVSSLYKPIGALMLATAAFALCAGLAGYTAAANGWVMLTGRLANEVPEDRQVLFLADLWAHTASYMGGFIGGIYVVYSVWRSRTDHQPEPAAAHL